MDDFYKKELLTKNVAMQVDMPKLHEKAIIRLEPDDYLQRSSKTGTM